MHSYLSYFQFKVWLHHFIVNWKAPISVCTASQLWDKLDWLHVWNSFTQRVINPFNSSVTSSQNSSMSAALPLSLSFSAVPPFHMHARRGKNIAATFLSVIFEKLLPVWHHGTPTSHSPLSPWPCVLFICGRSSPFIGRSGFPIGGSQWLVSGALTDTGGQRKVSARHCPGARAVALKAYRLPTEVLFHAFDLV